MLSNVKVFKCKRKGCVSDLHVRSSSYITYRFCALSMQDFLTDRFCALFTEEEFLIMENAEDIGNYWDESVGIPINVEQAADLVQALFDRVNGTSKNGIFPSLSQSSTL